MGMITEEKALGAHVYAFRGGDAYTVPAAGVASAIAMPGPTDTGWLAMGDIQGFEDKIVEEEKKTLYKPSPGMYQRKKIVVLKHALDFEFTVDKISPFVMETFYRTATKLDANSHEFAPLERPPREVWLIMERYDQNNVLVFAANVWGQLTVTGGMKSGSGDLVQPTCLLEMLASDFNTMALGEA